MKRVQLFLLVNAGKWLIAEAISRRPDVRAAMQNGALVLKAGTTTSCLCALLTGQHLRICGRITPRGAVANLAESQAPHTVLLTGQGIQSLDGNEREAMLRLGPDSVLVTGANLIDHDGRAALLAGSPGGGSYGAALSAVFAEGIQVLIAAGTEKLTLGNVPTAIAQARRKGVAASQGMACGLLPLVGQVITELDAICMLAPVEAILIGKGGISGAEGGSLIQVWGNDADVDFIWELARCCSERPLGGTVESLSECRQGAPGCREHLSCVHRSKRAP